VTEKRIITLTPSVYVVKLFVIDVEANLAIALVPAKPFQPSRILVSDNGAKLSGTTVHPNLHHKELDLTEKGPAYLHSL